MTTQEKIILIDQELTEPHSLSSKWVEMLEEYREMLIVQEKEGSSNG